METKKRIVHGHLAVETNAGENNLEVAIPANQ
jgi:hypothetical protein